MTSLFIIIVLVGINLAIWAPAIKRARLERRRRLPGVIGSNPRLNEVLHQGLLGTPRQLDLDWLDPQTMRNKLVAWKRQQREGRP